MRSLEKERDKWCFFSFLLLFISLVLFSPLRTFILKAIYKHRVHIRMNICNLLFYLNILVRHREGLLCNCYCYGYPLSADQSPTHPSPTLSLSLSLSSPVCFSGRCNMRQKNESHLLTRTNTHTPSHIHLYKYTKVQAIALVTSLTQ